MQVKEDKSQTITEALISKFGHPSRSEGLHVSRIIRDLQVQIGRGREDSSISQGQLQDFGTIGFVWERVLETTLADLTVGEDPRYMRLGELSLDGLYLTPDYCDLDFHGNQTWELGLEEWKVKWCSYRKGDDLERNFWEWLVQCKAYCFVLGTGLARIRALFIAGDWKGSIAPVVRQWELTFTGRELQDNWEMLTGHARRRGWLEKRRVEDKG
jgi:hypothetical protein